VSLMLSPDELADLRAEVLGLLPDQAVILRPEGTVTASGAWSETYRAAGTVAARIDPLKMTQGDRVIALQERGKAWYQLTVPWNADLRDGDRVSVANVTYELVQVHDDHSQRIVRRGILSKLGAG